MEAVKPAREWAGGALPSLERKTLNRQAYAVLRGALMAGRFSPGEPITLRSMAAALGISRQPVLEALKRLEAEGALVASQTSGTLSLPLLTADAFVELSEIRTQLEGLAAEKAARAVTEAELVEIRAACQQMQVSADAGDREGYVTANWGFHSTLYRSSRAPLLCATIETFWSRVGPYVRDMMPDRDALVSSMPAHWDAVQALADRNARLARDAIRRDIRGSGAHLLATLRAAGR